MTDEERQRTLDQRFVDQAAAYETRITSLTQQLEQERESARKIQQTLEIQLQDVTASLTTKLEQAKVTIMTLTDRIEHAQKVLSRKVIDGRNSEAGFRT
jgi:hypothetical protein